MATSAESTPKIARIPFVDPPARCQASSIVRLFPALSGCRGPQPASRSSSLGGTAAGRQNRAMLLPALCGRFGKAILGFASPFQPESLGNKFSNRSSVWCVFLVFLSSFHPCHDK